MLLFDCINEGNRSQGFVEKDYLLSPDNTAAVYIVEKTLEAVNCPVCQAKAYINDLVQIRLKDMPLFPDVLQSWQVHFHQYECPRCGHTFRDNIPFRYPGTRITRRAAAWIQSLFRNGMSMNRIHFITGIHGDTIRKVVKDMMRTALDAQAKRWQEENYRPRLLAVDEFAIHKGHSYATCVIDLETGEVLWVGKDRTIAAFSKFFEEMPKGFLDQVEAVAMDMNAAYHRLVQKYLPFAAIVYDRYHMQAQYGREVLGAVRLAQAKEHKEKANEIKQETASCSDETPEELANQIKDETQKYRSLKRLRWPLLANQSNLSEYKRTEMLEILDEHAELSVCYAMKEEICRLFALRDYTLARSGWQRWFDAAQASEISALEKFGRLKYKRLEGLIAHAVFPISTGKLEGFNNRIKVMKRIAYGYRDDDFFFMLIRFAAIRGAGGLH